MVPCACNGDVPRCIATRRLVFVLGGVSLIALLPAARATKARLESHAAGTRGGNIPDWKLKQVLEGVTLGQVAAPSGEPSSDDGSVSPDTNVVAPLFKSTAAQDRGACSIVKLSRQLFITPNNAAWLGQTSSWAIDNNIVIATASQTFFSSSWQTTYITNLDRRKAITAAPTTEQDLDYSYGWSAKQLQAGYPKVKQAWKLHMPSLMFSDKDGHFVNLLTQMARSYFSVTDCEGALLFVLLLWTPTEKDVPGAVDIYDGYGNLVASALNDRKVARLQFVDTMGNLVATAEAPGIGQNVSIATIPKDPLKGNILPYELHFQRENQNASQLLDQQWRWVVALGVQARAFHDAQRGWTPQAPVVLTVVFWLLAVIGIVMCFGACRLVYHRAQSGTAGSMWPAKAAVGYPQYYAAGKTV